MSEVERRTFGTCGLGAVQEDRGGRKGQKGQRTIEGYAAVFNETSDDLGGFREVILPGAFDRALREGHDVRALVNHNPDFIIGRTKAETLSLAIDERGLFVEILPPDTTIARDLVESIGRGDVTGMSFAFRTIDDEWKGGEDGEIVRLLKDLELFDVSPVAFPAYPQTSISTRAIERARVLRAAVVSMEINVRRQRLVTVE